VSQGFLLLQGHIISEFEKAGQALDTDHGSSASQDIFIIML
jgi:hypothetical protein